MCSPANTLSDKILDTIRKYTVSLAKEIGVKGLLNIQFAVKEGVVYILEANPRASRTTPYVSKSMIQLAKLAAKMTGKNLQLFSQKNYLTDLHSL